MNNEILDERVQDYLNHGYELDDAEKLVEDGIEWVAIPNFLEDSKDYDEIVAWLAVADDYVDNVAEAAKYLGMEPETVNEAYAGKYWSDAEFAEVLIDEIYNLDNPNIPDVVKKNINWEGVASDIMYDYEEHNHHYFRRL